MKNKKHEVEKKESPDAIPMENQGEQINIGDWYWVKYNDWDKKEHEDLMCVEHVGSNFIKFTWYDYDKKRSTNDYTTSVDVHFDNFFEDTRFEPNWKEILQERVKKIQNDINSKIKQLSDKAFDLKLINIKDFIPKSTEDLLPSTYVSSPDEYKNQLVKAKDNIFPVITEEIDGLNNELMVQTRNMYLPSILRMGKLKEQIEVVEDRIFTVELYIGVNEEVKQINKGDVASADEPVAVRQMLLYMDEECLFDYKSGGMDFKSLDQFDKWIVKKKNLDRILPEKRGIVAMQIRRNLKDYGIPESIFEVWVHMRWNEENKHSYLLIRNGDNVYRIATAIDFSPRLIPKKDELMSKEAFKRRNFFGEIDDDRDVVTPDDIEYDKHLSKEINRIKQYNRIILILQGLIDRTDIFDPMPKVRLSDSSVVDKWIRTIRDEENVIDSPPISWEEYRDNLNKTLRKGKVVYGVVQYYKKLNSDEYGGHLDYNGHRRDYGRRQKHGWQSEPYDFSIVKSVKKDKSAVKVTFPWGETNWKYDSYKGLVAPYESSRKCNLWVPMKWIINVTDYNLDDYKMFLCNRHANGQYLKWAPYLLSAEDYKRGKFKEYKVEEVK